MIESSLKEKALLVDFDGGYYEWHRRDRKVEKDVGKRAGVSPDAGRFKKNIFYGHDHLLHSLRQVVQHARNESESMTLPWHPARRLLLNINYLPHQQKMIDSRNALDTIFGHLDAEWDNMLQGAQNALGPLFDPKSYPTLEDIKQRTYIRTTFYPIPDASDVRIDIDEEHVKAIQEEVAANERKTFHDAVFGVWERVYKIVQNAHWNLAKTGFPAGQDQRFRSEWYQHMAQIAPVLKGLNLGEDPRLDDMADQLLDFLKSHDKEDRLKQSRNARVEALDEIKPIFDNLTAIFGPMEKERTDAP